MSMTWRTPGRMSSIRSRDSATIAALLAVAWDDTKTVFTITQAYFQTICDYMEFENVGMVLGGGCGTPELTSKSPYMQEAYELGKSLK